MRQNRLYVHMLLDRSGSMEACRDTAIGAFNEYVSSLVADETIDARLSLTLFDSLGMDLVHDAVSALAMPRLDRETFVPSGMTPLNDAIGQTVAAIDGARLREAERVAMVILTDGLENASREYTRDAVRKLLDGRQKDRNWLVLYLGANQDAFAEGAARGMNAATTMDFDVANMPAAMAAAARASASFAESASPSAAAFTPSERARARR
jgi:Mg-chelatase subunit ChlD